MQSCSQVCSWVKLNIFRLSFKKLTSLDPWPSFVTFDPINMWGFIHYSINPVWFQSDLNVSNEVNFAFYTWPLMTFDLGIWPLTASIYKGSHILSINQVWLQSDFHFSNEATFTFPVYLTTWPQINLWPWYVTFDLINKCRFPCYIYDTTLVEIHQSIKANVNPFSQQTSTEYKVILCVFPATWKAGGTSSL